MYRGETITTTITNFPVPMAEIDAIWIIYRTALKTKFEKTLADCTIDGESLTYSLTQEESLSISTGPIYRCVVVMTKSGARFESAPNEISCAQTSKPEVLYRAEPRN